MSYRANKLSPARRSLGKGGSYRARQGGQSLLEILMVIAVIAVLAVLGAELVFTSLQANRIASERDVGLRLAEEEFEAVRSVATGRWEDLFGLVKGTTDYYPAQDMAGVAWELFLGTENVVLNSLTYTRSFTIQNVCRDDSTRDITGITDTSGSTTACTETAATDSHDPSTQRITASVSWPGGATLTSDEYVARWRNQVCLQTSWATVGGGLPTVQTSATSTEEAVTMSHTVSLPSGVVSGNLLIAAFSVNGTPSVTWPMGWTEIDSVTTDPQTYVYYRQSDGTEGASITITTDVSEKSAHLVYRISGHEDPATQAPEFTLAQGTSASPDSPNLTPTGGQDDYLWLSLVGTASGGDDFTAAPASYVNFIQALTGISGGAEIAGATRELNATSEDPGNFTVQGSLGWNAYTVAVHPTSPVQCPSTLYESTTNVTTGASLTL